MFVINDIELLMRLGRHRILDFILSQCVITVSAVRLSDYSLVVRKEIERYSDVVVRHVDQDFHSWLKDKRKYLSIGDLSSIYVAAISGDTLVTSSEDIFLPIIARESKVAYLQFDDFIIATIKDEKAIQLYYLIKVA